MNAPTNSWVIEISKRFRRLASVPFLVGVLTSFVFLNLVFHSLANGSVAAMQDNGSATESMKAQAERQVDWKQIELELLSNHPQRKAAAIETIKTDFRAAAPLLPMLADQPLLTNGSKTLFELVLPYAPAAEIEKLVVRDSINGHAVIVGEITKRARLPKEAGVTEQDAISPKQAYDWIGRMTQGGQALSTGKLAALHVIRKQTKDLEVSEAEIEACFAALKDDNLLGRGQRSLQSWAIESLISFRERINDRLLLDLDHQNDEHRKAVIAVLSANHPIDSPLTLRLLEMGREDESPLVHSAIASAISFSDKHVEESVKLMMEYIDSYEAGKGASSSAINGLGRITNQASPEIQKKVIDRLVVELTADNHLYGSATNALTAILVDQTDDVVHQRILQWLPYLDDPKLSHRFLYLFGQLGERASAATMTVGEILLDAELTEDRLFVLSHFWKISGDTETVIQEIEAALDFDDHDVQQGALRLAMRIGPGCHSLTPKLINLLQDPECKHHEDCLKVIGSIGPQASKAVPELIKFLDHADNSISNNSFRALAEIGPKAEPAVDRLIEVLGETAALGQMRSRRRAMRTLGKIGPAARRALPELRKLQSDKDLGSFAKKTIKLIEGTEGDEN